MPALLMRSSTFRPVPVSVETCVSSYAPLFGIEVVRRKNAVGVGRERGLERRVEQQALERAIEVAHRGLLQHRPISANERREGLHHSMVA